MILRFQNPHHTSRLFSGFNAGLNRASSRVGARKDLPADAENFSQSAAGEESLDAGIGRISELTVFVVTAAWNNGEIVPAPCLLSEQAPIFHPCAERVGKRETVFKIFVIMSKAPARQESEGVNSAERSPPLLCSRRSVLLASQDSDRPNHRGPLPAAIQKKTGSQIDVVDRLTK